MLCFRDNFILSGRKCFKLIFAIPICLYLMYRFLMIEKHDDNPIKKCFEHSNNPVDIDFNHSKLAMDGLKTNHMKLLLISEARSGSTFLGDLLHHAIESSYYSFEPFVGVQRNPYNYEQIIEDIFSCRFDLRSYLKPLYWKIQYMKWNHLLLKAIGPNQHENNIHLFNKTIHQITCQYSSVIIIKTIRFTMKHLSSLMFSKSSMIIYFVLLII